MYQDPSQGEAIGTTPNGPVGLHNGSELLVFEVFRLSSKNRLFHIRSVEC